MASTSWKRPIAIAILVRALSLLYLVLLHPSVTSPDKAFDTSTSVLLAGTGSSSSNRLTRALDPFVKWDNIYFAQIAVRGYQHEQELAFMPVWPLVMRWSGMLVLKVRLLLGGRQESSPSVLNMTDIVVGGTISTNVISVLNVVAFHKLTRCVTKNERFTRLCAILYALHPAPAIASVAYTEPFYTLCVFVGSWLVVETSSSTRLERLDVTTSRMRKGKLYGMLHGAEKVVLRSMGIAFLMLASGTRSLGMLNCAVIAWPILLRISYQRFRGFATTLRMMLSSGIECLFIVAPFVAFQYHSYLAFCTPGKQDVGGIRPWCAQRLPLAYSFVQSHYWDVGFLRYWTPAQIPNFLLASPILVASVYGPYRLLLAWRLSNVSTHDANRPNRRKSAPSRSAVGDLDRTLWQNPGAMPFFAIHTVTTVILIFASHTQIALRVSMGNPALFWIVGAIIASGGERGSGRTGRASKWARRGVIWSCVWGSISLVLWSGFYPPA